MSTTLWLLRHAAVELPEGLCYGALDVAARSTATQAAAHTQATALPQGRAQGLLVWHSPLRRCTALAQALADLRPDLCPQPDARLREMDFGDWEGQKWSELPRTALDQWSADFVDHRPGGGENVRELLARVAQALQDTAQTLAHQGGTHAVWVTHAGVMRAVQWLRSPAAQGGRFPRAADWPQTPLPFGQTLAVPLAD